MSKKKKKKVMVGTYEEIRKRLEDEGYTSHGQTIHKKHGRTYILTKGANVS